MTRTRTAQLALLISFTVILGGSAASDDGPAAPGPGAEPPGLRALCSRCHLFTPPDLLPRALWSEKIEAMFRLGRAQQGVLDGVSLADAVRWYQDQAPAEIPHPAPESVDGSGPRWRLRHLGPEKSASRPAVSNVLITRLPGREGMAIVACDMRHGVVAELGWGDGGARRFRELAAVPHPAHAEPLDLDGDGILDLLIADLGSFVPTDLERGQVVWLRGLEDGSFQQQVLQKGLGRVSDVRAGDMDGDGDLDLMVAAFGWRKIGDVRMLETLRRDPGRLILEPVLVDSREGTIHVPLTDLDGDGNLDVVALISQHYERVVVLLGNGEGRFEARDLFVAPHPDWGMTGLDLVDLDADGDLDVLVTNGDTLDDMTLMPKPHHGITWLENQGDLEFEPHLLARLWGAHRAVATDLDGDGDLDVVGCAFLPHRRLRPELAQSGVASLVWLERTGRHRFERHVLEVDACDHGSLAVGDVDGDGDVDIAVGNLDLRRQGEPSTMPWVTVWENLGK